ncbi:MAG TPA: DNA mismatch repair protein MutS [Anaerolineales bacterium]|nr:DNA mismatch repair protein MutS [Anaerolineales bacterium]
MADSISPVRKQYLEIKRQHPDAIVFFRLGDFYETFDQDAETAARELEIVLTSRNVAKGVRVPMAGIPHHAAESYLAKLISRGFHVAICEQVGETPVDGLFPREVVRVVTPGTVLEPGLIPGVHNNFLAAAVSGPDGQGFAFVDITTGEFFAAQATEAAAHGFVRHELARVSPSELLVPEEASLESEWSGHITVLPVWKFDPARAEEKLKEHFGVRTLDGFGLGGLTHAIGAAGAILDYLQATQPVALALLSGLSAYGPSDFMALDSATRRNLELSETLRTGEVQGSLMGVLDATMTPMGRRMLRQWMGKPLLDRDRIETRLDQVQSFFDDGLWRAEVRQAMKRLSDLERLTNRVASGLAGPRDLVHLRDSLEQIGGVRNLVDGKDPALDSVVSEIDPCPPVSDLVRKAIVEVPPATLAQPGVIRPGFSQELDQMVDSTRQARDWIAGLEATERERTGIKSLKVGYNKVFGYYIEVTRAHADEVPEEYIRKQTLVNAERFITPEMKDVESKVVAAEERIRDLESEIYRRVCSDIGAHAPQMLRTARAVARLDAVSGLAEVAALRDYVRPEITEGVEMEIRDGRHPVVEGRAGAERFVPNDAVFEEGERIRILTGPNMAGKSTYLRQVALIVLLAQMGSFVPARSARIGLVDRIFTRIGAQDEIYAGQSTFMVEMVEAANILHNATGRSLLILDEIGRGTSTYDGLSIAWAMVEFIHNHPRLRSRTLFATHYHELTRLAEVLPGVRNYNVAVAEEGGRVVFLHRIIPGGADRSYGVHVAELAGLPRPVIHRAEEILSDLETEARTATPHRSEISQQLALFPQEDPLRAELEGLDLDGLSPLDALNKLFEWKSRFAGDDKRPADRQTPATPA